MRDIQARRHRKIVGPTSGDRARAVGRDPAHVLAEPDQADVDGWENEGGARYSDRDSGAIEAPRPTLRLVGRR
jgi:hypothetical protein